MLQHQSSTWWRAGLRPRVLLACLLLLGGLLCSVVWVRLLWLPQERQSAIELAPTALNEREVALNEREAALNHREAVLNDREARPERSEIGSGSTRNCLEQSAICREPEQSRCKSTRARACGTSVPVRLWRATSGTSHGRCHRRRSRRMVQVSHAAQEPHLRRSFELHTSAKLAGKLVSKGRYFPEVARQADGGPASWPYCVS